MPKSYTEKERQHIVTALREAAWAFLLQKGVKKTTVDELVREAHIPKGTFYLFYPSKEMLLYDALMQKEEAVHQELAVQLQGFTNGCSPDALTEFLFGFFQQGLHMGILPLMLNGELDILMRKLPDEVIARHISKDDEFLTLFRTIFPDMTSSALNDYSAAFRAVFLTAAYQREIGASYENALKLLIRGLVLQMKRGREG